MTFGSVLQLNLKSTGPVLVDGNAAGQATVTGVSAATANTAWTASGTSTATGVMQAFISSVGASAGASAVNGSMFVSAQTVGGAAGLATVTGIAAAFSEGTPGPAVMPRYLFSEKGLMVRVSDAMYMRIQ